MALAVPYVGMLKPFIFRNRSGFLPVTERPIVKKENRLFGMAAMHAGFT